MWWIYGKGSKSDKYKCALDKVKFQMGEIIGGKISAIQFSDSQ